jgi:hypothetical protein
LSIQKVLDAARAEIGYNEKPNNNNKFAKVAGHANYQPWCATFIRACFIKGQEEKAIPDSAYCPHIEAWARANNRVVPTREAKRGDLVLFDFTRSGKSEHIELLNLNFSEKNPEYLYTIGGNTGAISASEGDGVQKKKRHVSNVRLIVRPDWSK